ncbi:MAG: hypothetical protein KBC02_00720 [Candidatus Pacebacteria bacterium]|nr:hypothetical protein [Candidatus Paceibacterota bacterium]
MQEKPEYSREEYDKAENDLKESRADMKGFEEYARGTHFPGNSYDREYYRMADWVSTAEKKVNELKDMAHEQASKLNQALSDLEREFEAAKMARERFIKENLQKETENK